MSSNVPETEENTIHCDSSSVQPIESIFFECADEESLENELFIKAESDDLEVDKISENSNTSPQNDQIDDEKLNFQLSIRNKVKKLLDLSKNNHVCKICKKTFTEETALERHALIHAKKFFCVQCGEIFGNQTDLVNHEQKHIAEKSKYFCAICHRYFFARGNLNVHMKTHEGKPKLAHACIQCNLSFPNEILLAKHNKKHFAEKSYTCNDCGKTFYIRRHMLRHVTVHLNKSKFECRFCQKTFVHQSSLSVHELLHSNVTYTCKYCFRDFSLQSNLIVHEIQHTSKSPFQCPFCKLSFVEKKTLILHIRNHLGEKPYSCDICNRTFMRQAPLIKHQKLHDKARPYKCPKCDKTFVTNDTLIPHMRIHNKDKPYSCDRCEKRFKQKKTLRKHTKIHLEAEKSTQEDNQNVHSCTQCDKKFYRAWSLERHMLMHAPKKTEQFVSGLKSRFKSLLHSFEVKQMNSNSTSDTNPIEQDSCMTYEGNNLETGEFPIPEIKMEPKEEVILIKTEPVDADD